MEWVVLPGICHLSTVPGNAVCAQLVLCWAESVTERWQDERGDRVQQTIFLTVQRTLNWTPRHSIKWYLDITPCLGRKHHVRVMLVWQQCSRDTETLSIPVLSCLRIGKHRATKEQPNKGIIRNQEDRHIGTCPQWKNDECRLCLLLAMIKQANGCWESVGLLYGSAQCKKKNKERARAPNPPQKSKHMGSSSCVSYRAIVVVVLHYYYYYLATISKYIITITIIAAAQ